MKFKNDFLKENKLIVKLRILKQLLFSEKYILIIVRNNEDKKIVNVNLKYTVTDEEMNFYTKYLNEYVKNTCSLIDNANDIIKRRET